MKDNLKEMVGIDDLKVIANKLEDVKDLILNSIFEEVDKENERIEYESDMKNILTHFQKKGIESYVEIYGF
jgi:bacterioferritin (cytochrome b1)